MVAYREKISSGSLSRRDKENLRRKKIKNRIIKVLLIALVIFFILYLNPNVIIGIRNNIFSGTFNKDGIYRGQVTDLKAEQYVYGEANKDSKVGVQNITVQINEGKFQGETVSIKNNYDNSNPYSYVIKSGDRIYLSVEEGNNGIKKAYIYDYDRGMYTFLMVGIFVTVLVIIGGRSALKILLSVLFILPMVLKILPFFLLRGYNYLIIILFCSLIMISVLSLIFQGVCKETFATILGSSGGILISLAFIYIFQYLCKITGIYSQEIDMILYKGNKINITGIIFSGIIIGALGAIMSISFSIINKMKETEFETLNVKIKDMLKAGFSEGKESLGKVFNTLILAYLGATLQTVIIFMISNNMNILQGINGETIVLEILRIITGSLGFLCAIPFTVIAYGALKRKQLTT